MIHNITTNNGIPLSLEASRPGISSKYITIGKHINNAVNNINIALPKLFDFFLGIIISFPIKFTSF
jgi:hypothetical protein